MTCNKYEIVVIVYLMITVIKTMVDFPARLEFASFK